MEERIVDKDDERLIRIKRTKDGVDAEDASLGETAEEAGEDVVFEIPDEEFDEDLVGLTPSQLQRELERRKKAEEEARAEYDKLVRDADALIGEGKYAEAEPLIAQAACYTFADAKLTVKLWEARTKNFTDLSPFYVEEYAEKFDGEDEECKAVVRERAASLKEERAKLIEEEAALAPSVLEKQQKRREAFAANEKYYFVRALAIVGAMLLAIVACAVSASYIVRTLNIAPVVCTAAFGAAAFALFVTAVVFLRKYALARRLSKVNESLSSTETGAKLEELRGKIYCLNLIFGDAEEHSEEEEA